MSQVVITEALLDNIATGKHPPQKGVAWAVKTSGVPLIINFQLVDDLTRYRYYRGFGRQQIEKQITEEVAKWVKA